MNFVKLALENGGSIHPLIIPSSDLKGPALTNPSIYNDDGKILVNLRNINYTLYHSEKKKFEHPWGPLVYIHPENDLRLRTWNYMCEMDEDMQFKSHHRVDTSKFPDKELWEFVGLEDARIVRWDGKLYICGVRRDLDTIGTGRMELSEIEITENGVKEISQYRIPAPGDDGEYCNKNWMPILDMPYHFVKWTNGTNIVKYDIETNTTVSVIEKEWKDLGCVDLRGGSQVISMGDYRFALTHETYLTRSPADRKDGTYKHRFIVWDKDWNIVKASRQFSFLNAEVEFAVGMCEYGDDYLITFGFQDNAAYLLRAPKKFVENYIFDRERLNITPTESINNTSFNFPNLTNKNNPSWKDIPGWGDHSELFSKYVNESPITATFVEIGSFMGRSSCCMGQLIKNSGKDIKLHCIDTFEGSDEISHIDMVNQLNKNNSDFYKEFQKNIEYCEVDHLIKSIKSKSLDACKYFEDESIDMIYIDGSHEYQDVLDDIKSWYPKLKSGGIMYGDDYPYFDGVRRAVDEYFGDNKSIVQYGIIWEHRKP